MTPLNLLPASLEALGESPTLALIPNLGPVEIGVILIIGLLLFGRKLPEVGRNVGRSIVEFKRGLKDVSHEIDAETRREENAKKSATASLPDRNPQDDARRVSRADSPEVETSTPSSAAGTGENRA